VAGPPPVSDLSIVEQLLGKRAEGDGSRWVQLGIRLDDARQVRSFFAADVGAALSLWTSPGVSEERARHWFFVRKPPGVLVRAAVHMDERPEAVRATLFRLLVSVLGDGGSVANVGPYLPETHLFGGAAGTSLTHAAFTADSAAVSSYLSLVANGHNRLGSVDYSLLLLTTEFRALVADPWEHWDVWARFASTGRLPTYSLARSNPIPPHSAQRWVKECFSGTARPPAGSSEDVLVDRFAQALHSLARQAKQAQPMMEVHLRSVLPFWAAFHWNRMGFDLTTQQVTASLVRSTCSPHDLP